MSTGATLPELQARFGPRYRWLVLLAVMIGAMAAIMSSTIINVAVPDLSRHFVLGQERAQWATSGFMVAMTVSMLTTPWLLSRYGYRRTYAATMWLMLAGGVAGGFSNDYALVLAARVVEGLAAGVVQPIPAIIILRAFEPHEQGRASGIFGMGVVLAPALGPSVGGLLVDWFGWRSIFFMVVPFCLLSLWLSQRYLPVTGPGGATADRSAALDWWGLLLAGSGTLCLLNGLVQWHAGELLAASALLAVALAALAGFWRRARRLGRAASASPLAMAPLVNPNLFQNRPFAMGSAVSFSYGMALFGSTYLIPVFMQIGLGLSASYVGTILLPAGLVLAFTIAVAGRLADRYPAHVLISVGLALLTASFALMMSVNLGGAMVWLVLWAILGRIGLGFIMPALNLGSLRGLEKPQIPQGASAINFVRMMGGAVGVSLCGIVLEWRLSVHGDSLVNPASSPARLAAFHETFLMLAALCALALLAAWRMREILPGARSR